ncbi:Snf7-domain-containing protein [Lentinula guzmanii]|uniref:Vacuolar-sorting protein SNF7 n=3 Tax=Lentinula TaxID=5352 RepID=A0AA38N509_9AGAR|nr:Snf7-domain-containing protein [Lentinula guzmanii]KAJ3741191.1 Snf7-domain-containing protein [Lentinula detonsa]KAJ3788456.1 Snf7-domain-containing protein [Lentinula aff. detonsa]KAJ3801583.1 Snf7-domain-containing protein [Lentinula aff. detonsa]KAJ3986927.1 Snf7-domain-containing protein [Lentinula detonsa]
MSTFMSWFGARRDPKQSARDAIVGLRQQLQMIEKKEEYLQKKIDEELRKAKANAVTNKAVATAALKRKKASEAELDRLAGTRLQLEMQVNTLESANLNAETMAAMKKAADALKVIHGNMTVDQVDATMNEVTQQREVAQEIADIISNPTPMADLDEDELLQELNDLEQEQLDERLQGAEHVPLHQPQIVKEPEPEAVDEEEELRQLRASMAM